MGDEDLHQPIEAMKVTSVAEWPPGRDWCYEMKLDGWRLLTFRQTRRVVLQGRSGRDLTRYFPDLAEAIGETLPAWTVLDSEAVIWSGDRADFAALQRRITAGVDPDHPAYLVAFDVLQHASRGVVLSSPLIVRRQLLEEHLADQPVAIPLCPHTDDLDQAQEWMAEGMEGVGIDGVVIKRARSRYRPGGTGWLKRRVTQTLDLVVGGVTGTLDRPHTLLLGRLVGDRLSYVNQTTALSAPAAADVAQMFSLRRVSVEPPVWPLPLPARWVGFHQDKPLQYLPVTPRLTVEVVADTAFEYGRYRHPLRLSRIRPDVT